MTWGIRGVWLSLCVAVACLLAAAPAAAAGSVRLGAPPRVAAQATDVGGVPGDTPIHLTVALKPRTGLAAFVAQVSDPASPLYRAYLTPSEFGQRFGATPAQLAAVEASLRAHGLQPGPAPASRLSIPVTTNASAVQSAFSLSLRRVRLRNGRMAVVPTAAPAVDAPIAGDVQAIVGLSSIAAPQPLLARRVLPGGSSAQARPRLSGHVATGGPQPCSQASSTASGAGAHTADQIAAAYQFSGLYQAGNLGQGQTIALYELEPNAPSDIAAYQSCYGTSTPVNYVSVDGGAGSGQGSGEAALDIEMAIGLAPKANILVYQGPNSNQGTPGSGPYDTFSAIINQHRAQVISTSWGQCEPDNGTAAANAENTLFAQAAAQGQTITAAAGDTGSEDCFSDTPPNLGLAVDDPGSQPYVTSVGGTTLTAGGPPPSEVVWNGGGNPVTVPLATGATGGGISQMWRMPSYQSAAAGFLNVVQGDSSGSPCGVSGGFCRQVPDVSADADPNSGYVIYWNGSGSDPTSPAGWQVVGGTSAASPLWGALMSLVNASASCHGSPVGFANPALYTVAGAAYGANFNDVTSGNNDFTGTNGGRYPAGSGYDMATGLGTPNGAALPSALCPAQFRINNPGRQLSSVGRAVALRITTNDPRSGVVYSATTNLPPGLSLNGSTGVISGKPTRAGTYNVGIRATNRDGAVRSTAFSWVIVGRPRVSGGSLTGLRGGQPRLQLTVATASGAAGVKSVVVVAPSGLRFVSRRGRIVVRGPGGRRITVRSVIRTGRLQLLLARQQSQVKLVVSGGALVPSAGIKARARHGRRLSLTFRLTATDANGLQTRLTLRVKSRG